MYHHLTGFIVYMLAMMGLIFVAIVIAKKTLQFSTNKMKNGFLELEGILPLEPRKSIYLVKAGNERFLVSSDLNNINFLTKLDDNNIPQQVEIQQGENQIIDEKLPLKEFPMEELLNFNNPQNPLCNMLKNFINRK